MLAADLARSWYEEFEELGFKDLGRGYGGFARELVPDEDRYRTGHQKEHGTGEEETVLCPAAIEQCGRLRVQLPEETCKPSDRVIPTQHARVSWLPGEKTDEEGDGDGKPCPVDRRDGVGFDEAGEAGSDIDDGLTETAEWDQSEEEARCREDGKEVVEKKDETVRGRPMQLGCKSPHRQHEDPGKLDREYCHDDVEEEALGAPGDSSEHKLRCSTRAPGVVHNSWRAAAAWSYTAFIGVEIAHAPSEVSLQPTLEWQFAR